MIQFRCTKKVQNQLGLKPSDLSEVKKADSTLGNWYVNLATIDRRKTFLFVNERTLFSFILFGVKKSHTPEIHEIFLKGLTQALIFENFDLKEINKIHEEYFDLEFTKTDSRKVLGNMNELMDHYKFFILSDGGYKYCDLTAIINKMNRIPQRNIEWKYSIEAVKDLLKT